MRKAHADAIRAHRLRNEIIATKVANRLVNRLGPGVAFDLTEEEGASLQQVDRRLPRRRAAARPRQAVGRRSSRTTCPRRCASSCSRSPRRASARTCPTSSARPAARPASASCASLLEPGVRKISAAATKLIRVRGPQRSGGPPRPADRARRERRHRPRAGPPVRARRRVRHRRARRAQASSTSSRLTRAYTRLGEALGLDWAQQQVARFVPADQWERLLTAGLARDFEQLRIEFLSRCRGERRRRRRRGVDRRSSAPRIDQFRKLVARARTEGHVSAPMLAQIAGQARILLGR